MIMDKLNGMKKSCYYVVAIIASAVLFLLIVEYFMDGFQQRKDENRLLEIQIKLHESTLRINEERSQRLKDAESRRIKKAEINLKIIEADLKQMEKELK